MILCKRVAGLLLLVLPACGRREPTPEGVWTNDPVRAAVHARDRGRPLGTKLTDPEWRREVEMQIARASEEIPFTLTLEGSGRAVRHSPKLGETVIGTWRRKGGEVEITLRGPDAGKGAEKTAFLAYTWDGTSLSYWTQEDVRLELERVETK